MGVNSDEDREKLKQTIQEQKLNWRSFWDYSETDGIAGPIAKQWQIQGWPTIYVIDADGIIRFKNVRGEKLERAVEHVLSEMGHVVDLSTVGK